LLLLAFLSDVRPWLVDRIDRLSAAVQRFSPLRKRETATGPKYHQGKIGASKPTSSASPQQQILLPPPPPQPKIVNI
jgi:hypothetical protein